MQLNIRKTIETSVTVCDEFPFYVEELGPEGEMPALSGNADEKYTFSEMNDEFFDFISRKASADGIFIRLVHIIEKSSLDNMVTFEVETGLEKSTFDAENPGLDEVTDIGIRVKGDEITLGTTVFDPKPHFESLDDKDFLAVMAGELVGDLIFFD